MYFTNEAWFVLGRVELVLSNFSIDPSAKTSGALPWRPSSLEGKHRENTKHFVGEDACGVGPRNSLWSVAACPGKVARLGLVVARLEERDLSPVLCVPNCAPSCVLGHAKLRVYPWLYVLHVWNCLYGLRSPG